MYADVKPHIKVDEGNGLLLEDTLDKYLSRTNGLDLKVSVEECAAVHLEHVNSNYSWLAD